VERHPQGRVQGLQGNRRARAIDQHLHVRLLTRLKFAGEIRWNLKTDICPSLAHHGFQLGCAVDFFHHAKRLRVHKRIHELAALRGAVLVVDGHGHVLHVAVERKPEGDDLQQRREKHEVQRGAVAQNGDEFLVQDRLETAQKFRHVEHQGCPPVNCPVRATNTSSSDGAIGRISTL
jgi:hypothetical protein